MSIVVFVYLRGDCFVIFFFSSFEFLGCLRKTVGVFERLEFLVFWFKGCVDFALCVSGWISLFFSFESRKICLLVSVG